MQGDRTHLPLRERERWFVLLKYRDATQTKLKHRDDEMMMMLFTTISAETKARRGDGEYGRLYEGAEGRCSRGTHHGHSLHMRETQREKERDMRETRRQKETL